MIVTLSKQLVVVISAIFATASIASAQSATWIVDASGGPGANFTKIQPALDAAQSGDTILVRDGIYQGAGNKNLDLLGKVIDLHSEHGPANCVIDPQFDGHGFVLHTNETLAARIAGFTVQNGGVYLEQIYDPWGNPSYKKADGTGGALVCYGANPTVEDCVFRNCFAQGYEDKPGQGGAVTLSFSSATFRCCSFLGNTVSNGSGVGQGGAIYSENGNPQFLDCLIAGNGASHYGGGFAGVGTSPTFRLCTIANNVCYAAQGGGGIMVLLGTATIENSILHGNLNSSQSAGAIPQQISLMGNALLRYSNLQGGPAGVVPVPGTGGSWLSVDWGQGNVDLNPQFANAAAGNYQLLPSSPCIDAASNAIASGGTLDLAGNPRFVDAPAVCDSGEGEVPVTDMGAYEFQPAPGAWANLGKALASANGKPCLVGSGTLQRATPASLTLSGAKAGAPCFLVIGLHNASLPFKGGILVPTPDRLFSFATTGASGVLQLASNWPANVPAGTPIYFQFWVADASAPMGFSASNAISGTTP